MNTKKQGEKLQKLRNARRLFSEKLTVTDSSPLFLALKSKIAAFYDKRIKKT